MTQEQVTTQPIIETLDAERMEWLLPQYVALLSELVLDEFSLGFLPPFPPEEAEAYWRSIIEGMRQGSYIVLAATRDGKLLGSVQLELMWKPNQPHRVELQKLLVFAAERRQGLGRRLVQAAEETTRAIGRSLIVLDTQTESTAYYLYQKLGYNIVGAVPNFALLPDGSYCPTTYFYKQL